MLPPRMAFAFLHTSDWQLGLKLHFIPGDAGAQARLLRYEAVCRLAGIARQRGVDAVLVAGDVLDSNAAGPDTIQRAREALAAFAPLPVLLLPGNHDHGGDACALGRLAGADLAHVRVLDRREPVHLPGAAIFPCPLLRRHEVDDPAAWLPARGDAAGIRVAMAHGGAIDFAGATRADGDADAAETPNLIDVPAILGKGFDYVALGDWHGTLRLDARAWYCGTPEPTRFKERDPGGALIVAIAAAGAEPQVERVAIAATRWLRWEATLADDAAVDALAERFAGLELPSTTCIELTLAGSLTFAARQRLEALLGAWAQRCMLLRCDLAGVVASPSEADIAGLAETGLLQAAVERLRADPTPEAADALLLLHRLLAAG